MKNHQNDILWNVPTLGYSCATCGEPSTGKAVANLLILWRTFLWRTFLIPSRGARKFPHWLNHLIYQSIWYQGGLLQGLFATERFTTVLYGSPQLWTVHHSIAENSSPQVKNDSPLLDKGAKCNINEKC